MTILLSDIKLLESERMNDNANGGGRRTNRVIVDGAPGNIFPKVSRYDTVYGRVNFRKIYGMVLTGSLDVYAGAHVIVLNPPVNPKIHVTLISTGSDFDTRTSARERVESYVVPGPESRMTLYGRQLVGAQAVLVYQRIDEPLPEVGEVYVLSKETSTAVAYQQAIRVNDIAHEVRTFTDDSGEFDRRLITLKFGTRLQYEFRGPDTPSRRTSVIREALVRVTSVADVTRFYGIHPLAEAAEADALTVRVDSIYTPIVPTTQRETPISLASIGGAGGFVRCGQLKHTATYTSFTGTHYFPTGVKPGEVKLLRGTVLMAQDDGNGVLVPTAEGAAYPVDYRGEVDYQSGRCQIGGSFSSDSLTFEGVPAVEVSQPARTMEIEITLGNRGTVYSVVLDPPPNPGSVIADYRALGKWYRLRDNGSGQVLGADPAYGVGTVDPITGAMVITLGAMPDVESSVLISWGSTVDYTMLVGASVDAGPGLTQSFTLTQLPVQPGSLDLTFVNGGAEYTISANGSGVITGHGVTGTIHHATGVGSITYTTRLPDDGTTLRASYNQLAQSAPEEPIAVMGTIDWHDPEELDPAPVTPGSFTGTMWLQGSYGSLVVSGSVVVTDNGSGLLVVKAGQALGSSAYGSAVTVKTDVTVGTITYSSGAIAVPDTTAVVRVESPAYLSGSAWGVREQDLDIVDTPGSYTYTQTGGDPVQTAREDEFTFTEAPLVLDLTATSSNPLVPGSVLFTLNGDSRTFFERNGTVYTALNGSTGVALACGSMDYARGQARLTGRWPQASATLSIVVKCCLSVYGQFSADSAFFRTGGSPLRPGSLYVQATALDGALLSGTADENGDVTGAKVRGQVVQQMGVARVEFGELISGEWTPIEIAPSTLRYSAVVLSNLPLSAEILGLDPVRLPADGKVPVYRPADVVVIHHTDDFALPNPAVAGATYSVGRDDLADLWLVDANGAKVDAAQYVGDLGAGTVTMAADLDLGDRPQPLKAMHRIEERQLLSDVQINGQLSLTVPLTRDFPLGSYVSSALWAGDLQASVPVMFDQSSWTGVWSDELIGSGAAAQYNDIDYPIEVLNEGAITERWRIHFLTGNPVSGVATFQLIGENLGVIASGNTGADFAPIDQLTGEPYMVIRKDGWGLGWPNGAQLRINTKAAGVPFWPIRTTLPGATVEGDSAYFALCGDGDA